MLKVNNFILLKNIVAVIGCTYSFSAARISRRETFNLQIIIIIIITIIIIIIIELISA